MRARDYQDYLSANRLVEAARERAAEIEREAHEVYQEQKRLGWRPDWRRRVCARPG